MAIADDGHVTFWARLAWPGRLGLSLGAALIVAGAIALALWSSRSDYGVLFSQLNEGDAANIVAQLKKQKVPYRLADDGATVEVPAARVYDTRLSLFSSGVPLNGGVGFEIYDHQGYGLTEEDQRVEYQRALQGELARTVDSLEGVKYARVHLVIPPQTIFKSDRQAPSAAVSLVLEPGVAVTGREVEGIQRLVAASVAGLQPAEVVINDQRGITLSAVDPSQAGESDAGLAVKRDVENYLEHKIAALLDRAYGPGEALVSVDVSLDFDQARTTVHSLVPLQQSPGDPQGAVLRRQQIQTGGGESQALATGGAGAAARPSNSTTDVEYEYGRRLEQIVAAPGTITRMTIGVIVPGALTAAKRDRITELVSVAAGASDRRGDEIDVESLAGLGSHPLEAASAILAATPPSEPHAAALAVPRRTTVAARPWRAIGLAAAALLAMGALLGAGLGRRGRAGTPPLTGAERQQLLEQLEQALTANVVPAARSGA